MLVIPATALGATSHGVVLSVSPTQHKLQVINPQHVVHAYRYDKALSAPRPGSRLRFRTVGARITKVTTAGTARSVSFLGRVLRSSSHRLLLRLGDGATVSLSPRASFAPGIVLLVTETFTGKRRALTIAIRAPARSSAGVAGERHQTGVVTATGVSSFAIKVSNGSVIKLRMQASALARANLATCDTVAVSDHQVAAALVADTVKATGTSKAGICAGKGSGNGGTGDGGTGDGGGGGDTGSDGSGDVVGNITAVSPTSVTVSIDSQAPMTFAVDDPSITDGYVVGDQVDVTYDTSPSGILDANDVEYNEFSVQGTVAAVSSGSLTITIDNTGQQETFTADPSEDKFDGVSVGDEIVVSYHESSGQPVVDSDSSPG